MLKERIQEILEFTKSESPYRKANKGWINQDIFLDLSPSSDSLKQNNEAAKVTLLWSPVNKFLSNIFLILVLGSILVFTSLSFVKGSFNFNLFNTSSINRIVKVTENKTLTTNQLDVKDPEDYKIESNFDINNRIDKPNEINSAKERKMKIDQKPINDKKQYRVKDIETSQHFEELEIKKSKSNFF